MTLLEEELIARIRTGGPLTIADYMSLCLFHPKHGYYTTREPFGAEGDFTTAPEISQMFGELIGLALAQCWLDQGAPSHFTLAELGPGRGTLMADVLRATANVPGFHEAAQIHLVEASGELRKRQSETIQAQVFHHDTIGTLPDTALFLIANEFFDALPIRQFQRDGQCWRERLVGEREGKLSLGLSDPTSPAFLSHRLDDTNNGQIVEYCASSAPIIEEISNRIAAHGGGAFIIDYGGWRSIGDTFQAIRHHSPVSTLETPGQADLTAHVDFEALAQASALAHKYDTQGAFLERLGITARAHSLAQSQKGEALQSHVAAHRRLTHPDEMGSLFKILALYPNGAPEPPGFS